MYAGGSTRAASIATAGASTAVILCGAAGRRPALDAIGQRARDPRQRDGEPPSGGRRVGVGDHLRAAFDLGGVGPDQGRLLGRGGRPEPGPHGGRDGQVRADRDDLVPRLDRQHEPPDPIDVRPGDEEPLPERRERVGLRERGGCHDREDDRPQDEPLHRRPRRDRAAEVELLCAFGGVAGQGGDQLGRTVRPLPQEPHRARQPLGQAGIAPARRPPPGRPTRAS